MLFGGPNGAMNQKKYGDGNGVAELIVMRSNLLSPLLPEEKLARTNDTGITMFWLSLWS